MEPEEINKLSKLLVGPPVLRLLQHLEAHAYEVFRTELIDKYGYDKFRDGQIKAFKMMAADYSRKLDRI